MTMDVAVKICGINSAAALEAAVRAGAAYAGFVLFPPSPRNISPQIAAQFAGQLPAGVKSVVLTVDADDTLVDIVRDQVRPDFIQAHGSESPARIAGIAARTGLPVIKALALAGSKDLDAALEYSPVADMLLFDARPPKGADRPGGYGQAFDWQILRGYRSPRPWLLAGGLEPGNVAEAIATCRPPAVDVSSGVESRSGVKDPGLIAKFVAAVRGASCSATAQTLEEEERP
ncbi:Phosphoribosylanthranilate isomerase [hydrothermal vent metagenome]|uniref:phosphoribosylanthranilate isomerase n=1 Tax=hydrothermal vent metagenome TaxID=652676 RepID=A0A3B0SYY0_9ZZZZ